MFNFKEDFKFGSQRSALILSSLAIDLILKTKNTIITRNTLLIHLMHVKKLQKLKKQTMQLKKSQTILFLDIFSDHSMFIIFDTIRELSTIGIYYQIDIVNYSSKKKQKLHNSNTTIKQTTQEPWNNVNTYFIYFHLLMKIF